MSWNKIWQVFQIQYIFVLDILHQFLVSVIGHKGVFKMWPFMSDPLVNPMTSPKSIFRIVSIGIVIDYGDFSNEDNDYSERKHNPKMARIVPTRKSYHD
jgi:hypothetical protein